MKCATGHFLGSFVWHSYTRGCLEAAETIEADSKKLLGSELDTDLWQHRRPSRFVQNNVPVNGYEWVVWFKYVISH